MNQELKQFLEDHEIQVINPIVAKGNSGDIVGYHLRSSSMKNHFNDFSNLELMLKNVDKEHHAVDGFNYSQEKHDIFIYKNEY